MSVRYYVKVDDRYYAEHADGTAYFTKSATQRRTFGSKERAQQIAQHLTGAKVRSITDDGWRPHNPAK